MQVCQGLCLLKKHGAANTARCIYHQQVQMTTNKKVMEEGFNLPMPINSGCHLSHGFSVFMQHLIIAVYAFIALTVFSFAEFMP